MKSYFDLIDQTFDYPTEEFKTQNNELIWHNIPLMEVIKQYQTPMKITYLPNITEKIHLARRMFNNAMDKHRYDGEYVYCYCTKSSHFSFVLERVLENNAQIETSSAYDLQIIKRLYENGKIGKDITIICNGFKRPLYKKFIVELINEGFENCIPILDNLKELDYYEAHCNNQFQIGIRLAADEEPNFEFYTSRLGVRYNDITPFFHEKLKNNDKVKLTVLHFFIHWGVSDTAYYWSELSRFVFKYCELKKICPELSAIDIGGGFPVKTNLQFEFEYDYMVDQIVQNIKWICDKSHVNTPNIITEFGSFTVAESGATIYSVLDQKLQNDKELWYMIDGSFITHIPDIWGINQKFIMLPINNWDEVYHRVSLGGLTCDSLDYYNSEAHSYEVFLPMIKNGEPLYIGFFHTGAYQESLGGYGGIQHCLIPSTKHVIIDKDENGNLTSTLFAEEQGYDNMLHILGY